ncbi:LPS export ABC transporter permease LptG [Aliikangiella sp. IMCC44653]
MFSLLDRYIGKQVIAASLIILIILTSLRSLFSLLDEMGDIGVGRYQISDALLYIGLMIPERLLEFFPMSVLIGSLFAMGSLAQHSELTVMRAAGITTWRIAASAIKASGILMLCVILVSEWLAPVTTKSASQLRAVAISSGELSLSQSGLWAKQGNRIIHILNIVNDKELKGLTIFQLNNVGSLEQIIKAESASQVGAAWQLNKVTETHFAQEQIVTKQSESKAWNSPLKSSQIESLTIPADSLNLVGLIDYIEYLNSNKLNSAEYELAAWKKVFQPFAIVVMMFLAVSFVFGPMRSVTMGARILAGVILGFGFHLANQSFGPVSIVYNLPPVLGALLPLILFAGAAWWLMRRSS